MTIVHVEGFEDRAFLPDIGFDSTHSHWSFQDGQSQVSWVPGRNGFGLKFIYNGAASRRMLNDNFGGATDQCVGSMYIRVPSAPSVQSRFFTIGPSGGATEPGRFDILASGVIRAQANNGTARDGPNVADDAWHRLDFHLDLSATTYVLHWAVDGVNQTDSSEAGQSAGLQLRRINYGSSSASHTLTITFDDVVLADAAGDYKIANGAAYNVGMLQLNGDSDKTHGGVNVIEDNAGNDIDGVTNAYLLINEIPTEAADYIQQAATGAGNYAEFTFEDTIETTILAVAGLGIGGSVQVANPNGTLRLVDSGGATLVDLFSGNIGGGSTSLRGVLARVPDPGGDGWTTAELNGVKFRCGFSTSASGSSMPRWTFAALYYAYIPTGLAPVTRKLQVVSTPQRW